VITRNLVTILVIVDEDSSEYENNKGPTLVRKLVITIFENYLALITKHRISLFPKFSINKNTFSIIILFHLLYFICVFLS
jgi:hypothetical protein